MSDWQWFEDYHADALRCGDAQRARLLQLHQDAFAVREVDPDRTLLLLADGRRLAQALGEPWWVLLFDHWRLHSTLHHKRDYRNVLDAAVRNVLEVRKPLYLGFPQRLWMYNDLVNIYLNLDPLGYIEEIDQTLTQAESELTPARDTSVYLLLESRLDAAICQDRLDDALRIGLGIQGKAQTDSNRWTADHFLISNFQTLCYVASLRKDWSAVPGWAEAGEALARRRGYQAAVSQCVMWQAAVARRAGDRPTAARLFRLATSQMTRLKVPRSAGHYEAMCGYHEADGNPETALRLRDQQLAECRDRGMIFDEFAIGLARLRLLRLMGRDFAADLAALREETRRFRRPESYLRQVEHAGTPENPPRPPRSAESKG
jgi:hypothetical protein